MAHFGFFQMLLSIKRLLHDKASNKATTQLHLLVSNNFDSRYEVTTIRLYSNIRFGCFMDFNIKISFRD